MNCAFFGSRDVGDFVRPIVRKAILDLIKNQKIDCFYVGNNGNFDFYVQCILAELKKEGYEIDFNIVLSHISEKALSQNQNATIFPSGQENAIMRFAISKRNDWIIKNSKLVVVYTGDKFSNSMKLKEKALKKGLMVIELNPKINS